MLKPFAVVKLLPGNHLWARKLFIHKLCKRRIYKWFCHQCFFCRGAWVSKTPNNSKISMGTQSFFFFFHLFEPNIHQLESTKKYWLNFRSKSLAKLFLVDIIMPHYFFHCLHVLILVFWSQMYVSYCC